MIIRFTRPVSLELYDLENEFVAWEDFQQGREISVDLNYDEVAPEGITVAFYEAHFKNGLMTPFLYPDSFEIVDI